MSSEILLWTLIILIQMALFANTSYKNKQFWIEYYRDQADDNFDFAINIIKSIDGDKPD